MTLAYLGIYILALAWLWGFYTVARIHALKFRNMSTHIKPVCNTLFWVMLVLSLAGFVLVIIEWQTTSPSTTQEVEQFNQPEIELERVSF